MKKIFSIAISFVFLFLSVAAYAQQTNFISHTVKSGETLTGIATKNHTTVGEIMRLNGWHTDSKLIIGDSIKIPQTQNLNTIAKHDTTEKKFSVTIVEKQINSAKYTVAKGDNLFQISKRFNVSIDDLKKWNNLTDGGVHVGQALIVGKSSNSKIVNNKVSTDTAHVSKKRTAEPEIKAQENIAAAELGQEKKDTVTTDVNTELQSQPETNSSEITDAGYFLNDFGKDVDRENLETVSGTAMIFKTASGWGEKKYYILMNNVVPGSIVRISSTNGKAIYAKVLWNMEDIKENNGLDFRISNSATAALDIADEKFQLTISYYK